MQSENYLGIIAPEKVLGYLNSITGPESFTKLSIALEEMDKLVDTVLSDRASEKIMTELSVCFPIDNAKDLCQYLEKYFIEGVKVLPKKINNKQFIEAIDIISQITEDLKKQ